MRKGFLLLLLTLLSGTVFSKTEIHTLEGINFTQAGDISQLELKFDYDNIQVNKFEVKSDKQIIIDLKNVVSTDKVMRAFDTSEFSGSVVFVSAYRRPQSENDLRIAIQLRDNVRSILEKKDNKFILRIENRFGVFTESKLNQLKKEETVTGAEQIGKFNVPKSDSVTDILENLTFSGRKKYIGRKISFDVKDIAVEDVLKMIADASGFNIITTSDIKSLPPVSLNLTNVPWDQALDTVLGLYKLVAQKNGIILMISTLQKATEEKRLLLENSKINITVEPLVTKIIPISYSKLTEIETVLREYLTKERGSLSLDERTNVIIVKDTPANIEKMRKIVESLDTQTPQVLIETKIVEVFENYSKEIGLQNGLELGYDPVGSFRDGTSSVPTSTVGASITNGTNAGPGFSLSTAPSAGTGARQLFGLNITRFNRLTNLKFQLQLMESESKGKVVASPKVITQNKKAAKISTSDTTSFSVSTGTGDSIQQSFEEVKANLDLTVTPQVTNEGSIVLEVDLSKDAFGARPAGNASAPPDKTTRSIKTNVLVDNGSTIVIGGIYSFEKSESHSGVPFLKDIPLIGWLFRTAWNPQSKKNEMIIFLTPRIINQEEAGLVDRS